MRNRLSLRLQARLTYVVCLVAATSVAGSPDRPLSAALIRILTEPQLFVGRRVEVPGYLKLDTNLYLYPTREHGEASDFASSLLVSDTDTGEISRSQCLSAFVGIVATLAEVEPHVFGLVQVERIYRGSSHGDCWTRPAK